MNILGYTTYQDINLDWVIQKIIELEQKVNSGGGGTNDHTQLVNRAAANQHPMSAITGLATALAGKQPTGNYVTAAQLGGAVDDALADAKASGEFDGPQGPAGPAGDTGPQGPAGPAGFSPSATVEQTNTGATITITDKDGTTSATVDGINIINSGFAVGRMLKVAEIVNGYPTKWSVAYTTNPNGIGGEREEVVLYGTLQNILSASFSLGITGAKVGDVLKVGSVDAAGVPTSWIAEAV